MACRAGNFFAPSKIFRENVLHNSNKFVQIPASDIGFRAFQLLRLDEDISIRRLVEMRVTGSYRGMVAVFSGVMPAVSFKWCVSRRFT